MSWLLPRNSCSRRGDRRENSGFVGLGTGFGATVIMDGVIEPLELGRFHYKKSTLEHYVGNRWLKRQGRKKWRRQVEEIMERLIAALKPDDVVIGGGNVKKLRLL